MGCGTKSSLLVRFFAIACHTALWRRRSWYLWLTIQKLEQVFLRVAQGDWEEWLATKIQTAVVWAAWCFSPIDFPLHLGLGVLVL